MKQKIVINISREVARGRLFLTFVFVLLFCFYIEVVKKCMYVYVLFTQIPILNIHTFQHVYTYMEIT